MPRPAGNLPGPVQVRSEPTRCFKLGWETPAALSLRCTPGGQHPDRDFPSSSSSKPCQRSDGHRGHGDPGPESGGDSGEPPGPGPALSPSRVLVPPAGPGSGSPRRPSGCSDRGRRDCQCPGPGRVSQHGTQPISPGGSYSRFFQNKREAMGKQISWVIKGLCYFVFQN